MAKREELMSALGPRSEEIEESEYEVKFTPPRSYRPPDDAAGGRTFEFVAKGYVGEDGKLCMTHIGGIPLDSSEDDEEEEVEEEGLEETETPTLEEAMLAQQQSMGMA